MIKQVMCVTRHRDMSREQSQDYWQNEHGPFFMKNTEPMRAKNYVQSLTIDIPINEGLRVYRGMLPEFDGVAEVWFESEQDLLEAMSSPEGQELSAAFLQDKINFIDHSKSSAFVVRATKT